MRKQQALRQHAVAPKGDSTIRALNLPSRMNFQFQVIPQKITDTSMNPLARLGIFSPAQKVIHIADIPTRFIQGNHHTV
jgi:hypothetical protein